MEDKEKEMTQMRDKLSRHFDEGTEMDDYQRGVYETLEWLLEDSDKPNIEDE